MLCKMDIRQIRLEILAAQGEHPIASPLLTCKARGWYVSTTITRRNATIMVAWMAGFLRSTIISQECFQMCGQSLPETLARKHVFTSFSCTYKLLTKMGHVLGREPIILKSAVLHKLHSSTIMGLTKNPTKQKWKERPYVHNELTSRKKNRREI